MNDAPRYKHDCKACQFMGYYEHYDLYGCIVNNKLTTVLARFGNEEEEYGSGLSWALSDSTCKTSAILRECLNRVKEKYPNILLGNELDKWKNAKIVDVITIKGECNG